MTSIQRLSLPGLIAASTILSLVAGVTPCDTQPANRRILRINMLYSTYQALHEAPWDRIVDSGNDHATLVSEITVMLPIKL